MIVPIQRARQTTLRRGLSLIEVIVSLVLVSTILLVSITASANLMRDRSTIRSAMRAQELAGEILDEISVRSFREPDDDSVFGPEPDEDPIDRATFDDIDDYDQYVDSPPTYRDGVVIDGYTGWTFQINVNPAESTDLGIVTSSDNDAPLRLITITCTATNGATTTESILISEISSNLEENTTFDRMRRVNLDFSVDRAINVSVPLRNQPTPVSNE